MLMRVLLTMLLSASLWFAYGQRDTRLMMLSDDVAAQSDRHVIVTRNEIGKFEHTRIPKYRFGGYQVVKGENGKRTYSNNRRWRELIEEHELTRVFWFVMKDPSGDTAIAHVAVRTNSTRLNTRDELAAALSDQDVEEMIYAVIHHPSTNQQWQLEVQCQYGMQGLKIYNNFTGSISAEGKTLTISPVNRLAKRPDEVRNFNFGYEFFNNDVVTYAVQIGDFTRAPESLVWIRRDQPGQDKLMQSAAATVILLLQRIGHLGGTGM